MQLILSIDDIAIKNNMSSTEETNGNEKDVKSPLLDKILGYSISSHADVNAEKQVQNGTGSDEEASSLDAELEENKKIDLYESTNVENENHVIEDESENISKEIKTECKDDKEQENSENDSAEKQSEVNCDKNDDADLAKSETHAADESHLENIEVNCKKDEDDSHEQKVDLNQQYNEEEELRTIHESQLEDFGIDDIENNTIPEDRVNNLLENATNNENGDDTKKNGSTSIISEDVIDIADEKENSDNMEENILLDTDISDDIADEKENSDNMDENILLDTEISDQSTENIEDATYTKNVKDHDESNLKTELDADILDHSTENNKEQMSVKNVEDHDTSNPLTALDDDANMSIESTEITNEKISIENVEDREKSNFITEPDGPVESLNFDKSDNLNEVQENTQNGEEINNLKQNLHPVDKADPTNKLMNFKLSNMLDILSDDEDNLTTKPESPKQETKSDSSNKQCISIEDDDDIMLIDDESTTKENKPTENNIEKIERDSKEEAKDLIDHIESKEEQTVKNLQNDSDFDKNTKNKEESTEKSAPEAKAVEKSPLLSTTTLKSFKKNLAEMTREELEDFCILKIVESVFDKSNLGEIKSQIKVLAQNVEEYKSKAKMLTKQNRDLQLVLKSVQEEQKKNSSAIAPLKITRSVGMQVLMTDKNSRKRQTTLSAQTQLNTNNNTQSTTNNNKSQNKSQVNPNTRNAKQLQQPIPVPRLIPAVNAAPKSGPNSSPQAVNNPGKSPTVNNIPNGAKPTTPAVKAEKRNHSKMSSVTVDLTDDEPPAKINNRNVNPSVRCVPPHSLLAPQRSPLPPNINSPKKVYIPISGPQSQNIRPGQTIMLKSVTSPAPRPRGPPNNVKIAPNTGAIRNSRALQRHPAPLPDFMKQYQPPNWKGLPPAPELKLAKVENGIVISWKIDGYREENHEEIASYQLFAYQETSAPPNTSLWKKIGDVKALPLPMACTLTQFMSGYKYYFAVRAVDIRSRFGPFSLPGSILLLKNQ